MKTVVVASDWAPIRAFDPIISQDPEAVYGDLLPILRGADLRVVNCECALTTIDAPACKSGSVFKGTPDHVSALSAVPFDVACLANNHVLDHGVRGLRDTLNVLERHGVRTTGAGLTEEQAHQPLTVALRRGRAEASSDRPQHKDRTTGHRDLKVHIVNFSEGEDLTAASSGPGVFGWEIGRVIRTVRQCKQRGGVVIAIGHCGLEYVPFPPPYVVAAFRAIVDAGADCVVGHHPHVPQGVEWYRGRAIAYSLGNFAFYQPSDLYWRHAGYFVELRFDGRRLDAAVLVPYRIGDHGLRSMNRREEADFVTKLTRISDPFLSPDGPGRAWNAWLDYYGQSGLTSEVLGILRTMKKDPRKGAAMLRNRLTTKQHHELWLDQLTQMMSATKPRLSRQARRLVDEWFTRKDPRPPIRGSISRRAGPASRRAAARGRGHRPSA
jgi:poly-gamma-glutamate capsule biosynthesis protein CapA/YwtB (metallophosphatase superfamily)